MYKIIYFTASLSLLIAIMAILHHEVIPVAIALLMIENLFLIIGGVLTWYIHRPQHAKSSQEVCDDSDVETYASSEEKEFLKDFAQNKTEEQNIRNMIKERAILKDRQAFENEARREQLSRQKAEKLRV